MKKAAFTDMTLCTIIYLSIKCHNLRSFKKGMILLCPDYHWNKKNIIYLDQLFLLFP